MKKIMALGLASLLAFSTVPVMADEVTSETTTENTQVETQNKQTRSITWTVTGSSVRIRTGAGLSYSTIGYLDKGTHVNGGYELYYADGYEWAPVTVMDGSLAGKSGYVTTSYLEEGWY